MIRAYEVSQQGHAHSGNEQNAYNIIEPAHEISNNVDFATSKASDQPAHTCSLIRAFLSHLNIL